MSNIVSTTPILKGLRPTGPTFYTFSSAVNDTILLFSTNNIRMNFSKFVAVKLPDWQDVTTQRLYRNPNDIKSTNDTPAVDDANTFFTKAYLQNYIENFTGYVDANRIDDTHANFAEAAFWKALMSVSDNDKDVATDADNSIQLVEAATYIAPDSTTRKKFKERAAAADYEPVIKFVGDVNMLNHVKSGGKEYLEVFAHIPTSAGAMEEVLLKPNDALSAQLGQVPANPGPDWISGHEADFNTAPAASKTYAKAIYDTADNKYNVSRDQDFLGIDWDDIESNSAKQTKYNKGNFEFNAILLYYDVFDLEGQLDRQRNLYGILLLDKFENISPVTESIKSHIKYQPDANQAGNAFGYRFNMQFSNHTNQVTSQITINDYSTVSMELYMAALQKLQVVTDQYAEMEKIILSQQQKMNQLSTQLLGIANDKISRSELDVIKQRIVTNADDIQQLKQNP